MDRIRSMVVGIDFTPASRSALRQAMRIASWNRARLQVVHALDPVLAQEFEMALPDTERGVSDRLVDELKREWNEFSCQVEGAESIPFAIDIDPPLAAVLRRVAHHRADLLVLGSHEGKSARARAGSISNGCVRRAPTKVLIVREDQPAGFKNVVVCVDFSDTSREALAQGVRVALQDDAFLHVLHVFEMPWTRLRRGTPDVPGVEERYRQALPVRLRDFAESMKSEMGYLVPEYSIVEAPDHGQAIADYVRNLASPLVVLGTRGRSSLHDLIVGSTAERVVAEAPCSILAIRPETPPAS